MTDEGWKGEGWLDWKPGGRTHQDKRLFTGSATTKWIKLVADAPLCAWLSS
jgi:hypothetical protein